MPALAYMLDMNDRTHGFYGTNEGELVLPWLVFEPLINNSSDYPSVYHMQLSLVSNPPD